MSKKKKWTKHETWLNYYCTETWEQSGFVKLLEAMQRKEGIVHAGI